MSRRIICQTCRDKTGPQHPEDVANGFHRRIVAIKAKKPEEHNIVFLSNVEPPKVEALPALFCDNCGACINDGSDAYCVTIWHHDEEIGRWEHEYGTVYGE